MSTSSENNTNRHNKMTFSSSMPASPIWFQDWIPQTVGATFAVCLGLSSLAILYKFTASFKLRNNFKSSLPTPPNRLDEARDHLISRPESLDDTQKSALPHDYPHAALPRNSETQDYSDYSNAVDDQEASCQPKRKPRFIIQILCKFMKIDILRCLLVTFQAGLGYLLMLAVMTYNIYYLMAILFGTFIGEVIFGQTDLLHDHI
ncbi:hypothetical protein CROQUDRAFT_666720 [Cronartium quercuum f. sp. fusiforme G11]|uniref:Copper transport protein n=1 Tax=Cronartium quercuum f. sp. fusiforme G11 TaxID=708437 RepID=A0A9P6N7P6_9BASI|nr:hypothetical protein CROQUDRAFT_666720 [Cronartium quercuum f. sp. fusiforme G11]